MKVEELSPTPTAKLQFKLAACKYVPQAKGCYVLSTFTNVILYIGLASNLNTRFKQHLDNPQKTNLTVEGKAIWFWYYTYDAKNLPKLERTWLNLYSNIHGHLPLLNKVNSPLS